MFQYLEHDLIFHIIIFQGIILLIMLSNSLILYLTGRHKKPESYPKVSILVPARNEEKNITRCINSLLLQDYPDFEVLVLDDESTDRTHEILEKAGNSNSKLIVIDGRPIPEGWLGKTWACSQLAGQSHGDLLFFTDADTFHQPDALRNIVTVMLGERADLLTGFPQQELSTLGEGFIVPFFLWTFYCFTPLAIAYRLRHPLISNAIGQMMLFRHEVYQAIGGHASVRDSITEDLGITKEIKKAGYRWRVMEAKDMISCHMYSNSKDAIAGLTKNMFAAFDFRLLPYLFTFTWLAFMFCEPLIVLIFYPFGLVPHADLSALLVCICLALFLWLIPFHRLGLPILPAFLYPLIVIANGAIALRSLIFSFSDKLVWKNRKLARPQWKLF